MNLRENGEIHGRLWGKERKVKLCNYIIISRNKRSKNQTII